MGDMNSQVVDPVDNDGGAASATMAMATMSTTHGAFYSLLLISIGIVQLRSVLAETGKLLFPSIFLVVQDLAIFPYSVNSYKIGVDITRY